MEIFTNMISCRKSSPLEKYSLHKHTNWEIVCQIEGEVTTLVGEKTFTLSEGDVMLIPPHTLHKGAATSPFRDLSLCSDQIDFDRFTLIKDYRGEIASLISIIARLCTEQSGDYMLVASSLVSSVCEMIKHEIGYSSSFPAVEKIKKEIYDHLSDADFDLASAILKTGFDKDYFRRRFKSETGKTPSQYMIDMKIRQAKQLLSDKKMFSIGAISANCGFSDSLYFSTCFKKHTGCSPMEYRKQILGK